MFTPSQIVKLAEFNQKTVYCAVKIASYIAQYDKSVSEREIIAMLKIDELAWHAIKTNLSAEIFVFRNGRIDLLTEENRPSPWDLPPSDEAAERKRWAKYKQQKEAKPSKPLGLVQQKIASALNLNDKQAIATYHQLMRYYDHNQIGIAVSLVEQKISETGPLDNPQAYLRTILKNRSTLNSSTAAPINKFPIKVKAVERKTNMLSMEFVGWEHTSEFLNDGNPKWKANVRQKIYRLRSGSLQFVLPKENDHIPSLSQDPGCIIIS
jgi:hypothetical protein